MSPGTHHWLFRITNGSQPQKVGRSTICEICRAMEELLHMTRLKSLMCDCDEYNIIEHLGNAMPACPPQPLCKCKIMMSLLRMQCVVVVPDTSHDNEWDRSSHTCPTNGCTWLSSANSNTNEQSGSWSNSELPLYNFTRLVIGYLSERDW